MRQTMPLAPAQPALACEVRHEVVKESGAERHLLPGDELVGLMRLAYRAWAADHGRQALALELSGFGGETHGAGDVVAGQEAREFLRR